MSGKKPGIVPIGDARRISEERNVPLVVIFAIHADREQFTVTTYGATKAFCRVAADYGKQFAEAVMQARVIASPVEPLDLPDEPANWRPAPPPKRRRPQMMSEERLKEIREIEAAETRGAFGARDGSVFAKDPLRTVLAWCRDHSSYHTPEERERTDRMAQRISDALSAVPELLAEVDRLKAENAELRKENLELKY